MASSLALLVLVVLLAVGFDYINGFHDTANAVATVVSTNVLPGRTAVLMAAAFNFAGAFFGPAVALTIAGEITDPEKIPQTAVAAGLLGAILWNLLTWYYGIPSSSTHALIGGLVGSVWCFEVLHGGYAGESLWGLLSSPGVRKALEAIVLSPLLGFVGGFTIMVLLLWLVRRWKPAVVNRGFRTLQLFSAGFMAFAHGSNDAQKSMGIIALALAVYAPTTYRTEEGLPIVPAWVILACATAMALGTASGGWRIMKTMGHKIIKLRPINGFAAETAGALVILGASHVGAPVSTTHVISASIMGVGASKRVSAVRWGVAQNMLWAWLLTIPVSAVVSAVTYGVLRLLVGE
jgi:PiT family inorganic phosphate transporter